MMYQDIIIKFNPHHDKLGRFTSSGNASFFTVQTKDKSKQYLADIAIERAKTKGNDVDVSFVSHPKNGGQSVDWGKEFSSVKTFSDAIKIVEAYMPGCLDIAKSRRKREEEYEENVGSNGEWVDSIGTSREMKRGDISLADVYDLRGYHGKVSSVTTEAFDSLIADGSVELYRGFDSGNSKTSSQKIDEFLNGETHYAGFGIYGSGTYAAVNDENHNGRSTAQYYSGGAQDGLVRFTLSKDAAVFNDSDRRDFYKQASKIVEKFYDEHDKAVDDAIERDFSGFISNGSQVEGEYSQYEDFQYLVENMTDNAGLYAALRGYDAIDVGTSTGYYIILNRGKVIADEQRYT